MRTYDLDGNNGAVATTYDYNVFTRENIYIQLHRNDTSVPTYQIDNRVYYWYDDDVVLEVSDLIRTKPQVSGILLTFNGRTTSVDFAQWDGISPESNVLLPPSVIMQPPSSLGVFYVELYYSTSFSTSAVATIRKQGGGIVGIQNVDSVSDKILPLSPTDPGYEVFFPTLNTGQEITPAILERYSLDPVAGGYRYRINYRPLECDKEYVRVRWTGRHGLLKEWLWEIVSRKTAVDNVIRYAAPMNHTKTCKNGYSVTVEAIARDMKGIDVHYLNDIAESNNITVYNELENTWNTCAVSETKTVGTTDKSDLIVNFELNTYIR